MPALRQTLQLLTLPPSRSAPPPHWPRLSNIVLFVAPPLLTLPILALVSSWPSPGYTDSTATVPSGTFWCRCSDVTHRSCVSLGLGLLGYCLLVCLPRGPVCTSQISCVSLDMQWLSLCPEPTRGQGGRLRCLGGFWWAGEEKKRCQVGPGVKGAWEVGVVIWFWPVKH